MADSFRSLARALRETADRLESRAAAAVANTLDDLQRAAEGRSRGPLTPADLRRLDHPYARRHGPRLNPDIVNEQSGGFAGNWRQDGPHVRAGGIEGSVYNADPKAPFLEQEEPPPGSTPMVARRPDLAAAEEVEPRFEARMEVALEGL